MGVYHTKLAVCLTTLVFSCTWVCRGEVIDTMDEEYLVHDYEETGIQGVSREDENSNLPRWYLDSLKTLLGLQARLTAVADAPSPNAESPSYDNSGNNNNNDNNSMPFLPLGPSLTTPTPPDHEFSSPALNFNAPYPEYKKKSAKGKVIIVSVVVTAAVTLVVARLLLYYMHWRFVGNGHAFEEQPRLDRGILNSSVSEGSDFFKGLNASELGTLHEGSDLAFSYNRDKFERVTFPTYLEYNDTIGNPEVQAMRLPKKPTCLPWLVHQMMIPIIQLVRHLLQIQRDHLYLVYRLGSYHLHVLPLHLHHRHHHLTLLLNPFPSNLLQVASSLQPNKIHQNHLLHPFHLGLYLLH